MTHTPIPGDAPEAKHTDTLVARLREPFDIEDTWGAFKEAADRIQQLEAENADLRSKLERAERLCDLVDSMGSDARHQRNAAEAALRRIAEGNLGDAPWQANYERIRQVARAALTEQANIRSPVQSEGRRHE